MKTQHDPEETFLKWKSWLETILEEVQELLIRKEIYQDLIEIINGNPNLHKPSAFWGWLTKVYTNDAAVGIWLPVGRMRLQR